MILNIHPLSDVGFEVRPTNQRSIGIWNSSGAAIAGLNTYLRQSGETTEVFYLWLNTTSPVRLNWSEQENRFTANAWRATRYTTWNEAQNARLDIEAKGVYRTGPEIHIGKYPLK